MDNSSTSSLVERTCTLIADSFTSDTHSSKPPVPLSAYRNQPAWVLLGDPGAGKTTAFEQEAKAVDGEYITARDFCAMGPMDPSKTLFIDGLDEMRANEGGQGPLQQMRLKLMQCRPERFRISCREADWLGASDLNDLKRLSADQKILALRLNHLMPDDVLQILAHKKSKEEAIDFVQQAQNFGVEELLHNPQTLQLLMDVVEPGQPWPQTRHQLYELACRKMVLEQNRRHRDAKRETAPPDDQLPNAAGLLCAIQLLSGLTGFALDNDARDEQHAALKELANPRNLPLLTALKTRLFRATGEQERMVPVHRSVAEYLAAQHVAQAISLHGLPFGRVLALLTGNDGGMMPDLRGLAAWLAVHCHTARQRLIEVDAFGVVLYGDVQHFSVLDKRAILNGLRSDEFGNPFWYSSVGILVRLGALCSEEMASEIWKILDSPSRDPADQQLLLVVLHAIEYGKPIPGLDERLSRILRDASYLPRICEEVAHLQMHLNLVDGQYWLDVLRDIQDGLLSDPTDDIASQILNRFYPSIIPPERVFDYLKSPKNPFSIGAYFMFWIESLPELTPSCDLPKLLEQIQRFKATTQGITGLEALEKMSPHMQLDRMVGELLLRCLRENGDVATDVQLYKWLGVGLDRYQRSSRLSSLYADEIAKWIGQRPERFKSIWALCAEAYCTDPQQQGLLRFCGARLYGAKFPDDILEWCLQQATQHQGELAQYFFAQAVSFLPQQSGQEFLTIENMELLAPWVERYPALQQWLEPFVSCALESEDWRRELFAENQNAQSARQIDIANRIQPFRQHLDEIRTGTANWGIFHELAKIYQGEVPDAKGQFPHERLNHFFGGDKNWVSAVTEGFICLVQRQDLPDVSDIVQLATKGMRYAAQLPCLLGMAEIYQSNPNIIRELDEIALSRIVLFFLGEKRLQEPEWFRTLLEGRLELVSSVVLHFVNAMLRAKKTDLDILNSLAYNSRYAALARRVMPELLDKFATSNATSLMLKPLDLYMKSALQYVPHEEIAQVIARKVNAPRISVGHKIYWLCLGLIIRPDYYEQPLLEFVATSQRHKETLASFFLSFRSTLTSNPAGVPIATIGKLLEVLGPDYSPPANDAIFEVTRSREVADLLQSLIFVLDHQTEEQATLVLEHLLAMPTLVHWHAALRAALQVQRIARRKATYRLVGYVEVSSMLANLKPVSAADLAALVFAHLCDIGKQIRDGNADEYQQFWDKTWEENEAKSESPCVLKSMTPKWENDCRQVLLPKLRAKLSPLSISAQPEGQYADKSRADIRVSFAAGQGEWNVPVEIKKDTHKDLWTAIPNQLIPRYVRDPGTDGYGIYLVFWFGNGMRLSPQGIRPKSAQELQQWLLESMTPFERAHIFVCVIDCAWPDKNNPNQSPEPALALH